jgi:glycosyltransferase involved in cell wall biosynthesis
VTPMLRSALTSLLAEDASVDAVCAGAGSERFVESMIASAPALRTRLHAVGYVSAVEIAVTLTACDLLLQPYPDGVTTRRTSAMSGLINGRAVLTTSGRLTESVWASTGAVALAPADDMTGLARMAQTLLADDDARAALAARGEKTYRDRFSLAHTIRALRGAVEGAAA